MDIARKERTTLLLCLLLLGAILVVYGQVVRFEFLGYDDDEYVTNNPNVRSGLTLHGVVWSFGTGYAANWHPLTWISHMLDVQVYGLKPGGHHATNLILHILNTLLLFLLLMRMTGDHWRPFFVAALFGLHPLHVESVAWVAERKDLLSTFFGILSLLAYADYVRLRSRNRYLLALLFLALGLMAKPMLVTFPFLYLLLDAWPLGRMGFVGPRERAGAREPFGRLVLEKLPFLALAIASSIITVLVQKSGGAVESTIRIPLGARLAHALVSYVWYLWKMIWPSGLCAHYPHPLLSGRMWPTWQVAGAAVFLLLVTAFALRQLRRRLSLTVGWLWYLGMLVPVIGLVQVGSQGMADRYTYFPLVGIFCLIVWGLADVLEPQAATERRGGIGRVVMVVLLGLCTVLAFRQAATWKDSPTVYARVLSIFPDDPVMQNNLGNELQARGRLLEAEAQYRSVLRSTPNSARTHSNLANLLSDQGRQEEAIEEYRQALALQPDYARGHFNLGVTLQAVGRSDEARREIAEAIRLDPSYLKARLRLGDLLAESGEQEAALEQYAQVLRIDPGLADAQVGAGNACLALGRLDEAQRYYEDAVRTRPEQWNAHTQLGLLLARKGDAQEATNHFDTAARLSRNNPQQLNYLGQALMQVARTGPAIQAFEEASRLDSTWTEPLKTLAILYASAPEPSIKDPDKALELARQAVRLSESRDPAALQILAAVHASKGELDEAIAAAQQALALSEAAGDTQISGQIRGQIDVYRKARNGG